MTTRPPSTSKSHLFLCGSDTPRLAAFNSHVCRILRQLAAGRGSFQPSHDSAMLVLRGACSSLFVLALAVFADVPVAHAIIAPSGGYEHNIGTGIIIFLWSAVVTAVLAYIFVTVMRRFDLIHAHRRAVRTTTILTLGVALLTVIAGSVVVGWRLLGYSLIYGGIVLGFRTLIATVVSFGVFIGFAYSVRALQKRHMRIASVAMTLALGGWLLLLMASLASTIGLEQSIRAYYHIERGINAVSALPSDHPAKARLSRVETFSDCVRFVTRYPYLGDWSVIEFMLGECVINHNWSGRGEGTLDVGLPDSYYGPGYLQTRHRRGEEPREESSFGEIY